MPAGLGARFALGLPVIGRRLPPCALHPHQCQERCQRLNCFLNCALSCLHAGSEHLSSTLWRGRTERENCVSCSVELCSNTASTPLCAPLGFPTSLRRKRPRSSIQLRAPPPRSGGHSLGELFGEAEAPSCTHALHHHAAQLPLPSALVHAPLPPPQQRQHTPAPRRVLTQCRRSVPPCRPALHTRADGTQHQ
jgi:hypothetical protein